MSETEKPVIESFYDSSSGRWIAIGPPEGTLVRLRPCCGPGGVHEGHEDHCHVLPFGKVMNETDWPHEHDHARLEREHLEGVWEVREQDCGAGVYLRRLGDKRTALVDPEQILLDVGLTA